MAAPNPDTRVADAINRVLEAEREMAGAIVEAQAAAQSMIESARETRRTILETARRRSLRAHEAMQAQLVARLARLDEPDPQSPREREGLAVTLEAATTRLARRLTSDPVT
jgi:vacuolar-type H+-ATPase subunit H